MNTMAKIAIGAAGLVAIGAAAAFFMLAVPQGMASAGGTLDAGKGALRQALSDTDTRFEVAQAAAQSAPDQTSSLPGGASSLQESYEDWVVVCATQPGPDGQAPVKQCAMTQQQASQQGGQRVLAIELRPTDAGFEAALFLPFGLALDNGVTLQIDDGQPTGPYRFRTCLPAGCMVPMTFNPDYMTALQKGAALKLEATADGGADAPFTISLKGFGAAAARLSALAK